MVCTIRDDLGHCQTIQVKFHLQINWLCSFLITGMYLSSPNLQSPLAIKKMQDRVVNILLSHLVGKNESQKLSWNIRTTAGNSGLPFSLCFYTEGQPLCKHFAISAWLDFEKVPALYKINALEEGKYFFHIHFQLLDQV